MKTSRLIATSILALTVLLISCGGGGGGNPPPTPPPPPNPVTLEIVQTVVPDGLTGQPYSMQMTSKGATGAVTWSISSSNASWASIEPATGKIIGTPTQSGYFYLQVDARDTKTQASVPIFIWILDPLDMSQTPPDAIVNFPYAWEGAITGGRAPYSATLTAGAMPAGVTVSTLNGNVLLKGTATELGTFTFDVTITDSATTKLSVVKTLTLKVVKLVKITSESLKPGVVGRAYSDTVLSVNGTPPLTWAANGLWPGFSINPSTGVISGTPTTSGTQAYYASVTDSSSPPQSDERFGYFYIYDVLHVQEPITTLTGRLNQSLYRYLSPIGGLPPVTATLSGGTLPPGVTLSGFSLQGQPTSLGTWNVGIRYQDSATPPQTYDQPVVITILPPELNLLGTPPTPRVGESYSYQMLAGGGTPPYKWDLKGGTLPAGLLLSQTGLLSGKVLGGGRFVWTARVTDSSTPAQSVSEFVVFDLDVATQKLGRNDTIATATVAPSYLNASLSPYEFPEGTAAPDTDFYKFVALAGTEVSIGTQQISWPTDTVLEILDSNGSRYQTCKDTTDDTVGLPIVTDTTPAAFDDDCINDDVALGEQLNSSLIFKVPGAQGTTTTFFAHVLDNQGIARPDMSYTLSVSGAIPTLKITGTANIDLVKDSYIGYQLNSSGGSGAVTWSVTSGSVPTGMSLSAGGSLNGTPTAAGLFTFTATARDSSTPPLTASKTFGARVAEPLKLTTTSLPDGQTGVPYSAQLAWSGGFAPYSVYSVFFDPGLSFDPETGTYTGKPQTAGTYSVFVQVHDADWNTVSNYLSLVISKGPLYIATSSLPNATRNMIYSSTIVADGGSPLYSWRITSGALPAGMALNASTGEVRGIATAAGVSSFTVEVKDSANTTKTATLQLTVQ